MIRNRRLVRMAIPLAGLWLLVSTGCSSTWWASHALSAGVGWLIGAATGPVTVETICFRNGEQVDCSLLPEPSL